MKTGHESGHVFYHLRLADKEIPINDFVGQTIKLNYLGTIHCIHCGRKTNKSFSQGYCFPCFRSLPETDMCIVKPEQCHFDQGTCRDAAWGEKHCMIDHTIYLANSSGLKIGITRSFQQETRWMDQGAIQALPIARVKKRKDAGLVEVAVKQRVSDKTNWRKMLKGEVEEIDLVSHRDQLKDLLPDGIDVEFLADENVRNFTYPVKIFPKKIVSYNFDKNPEIQDELQGIKGQYLIFAGGVINMRKFAGYDVRFEPPH